MLWIDVMTRDELIAAAGNRSGIYLAVCTEGKHKGWKYVGRAVKLRKRLNGHGQGQGKQFFAQALRKYAFDWSIIEYCPADRLDKREAFYIKLWNTNKGRGGHGFNLTDGGRGSWSYIPTDATRAKISAASKRRKPISAETRAKLSAANKGKNRGPRQSRKNTAISLGKGRWNKGPRRGVAANDKPVSRDGLAKTRKTIRLLLEKNGGAYKLGSPRPDDPGFVLVKLRLAKSIHRRMKMAAAERGQTIGQTIAETLDKGLPKYAT